MLIVLSFLFIFWVIKVNSYAASNIRVEKGQKVIDTGRYAYVRHPMYAGAIWLFIAIPLALGAWWWTERVTVSKWCTRRCGVLCI